MTTRTETLRATAAVAAVALSGAMLAACDEKPPLAAPSSPSPTASISFIDSGCAVLSPPATTTVSVASAEPADGLVQPTRETPTPESLRDPYLVEGFGTLAEDGSIAGAIVRHNDQIEIDQRFEIVMLDAQGNQTETIDPGPPLEGIVTSGGPDERHGETLAWRESSSGFLTSGDWVIYVHHEGVTRLVASSYEITPEGELPKVDVGAYPSLTPTKVYWNSLRPKPGVTPDLVNFDIDDYDVVLLARNLDGSGPIEVASPLDKRVVEHDTDEDGNLYYMTRDDPELGFQIVKRAVSGEESVLYCGTLREREHIVGFAASRGGITWSWGLPAPSNKSEEAIYGITVLRGDTLIEITDSDGAEGPSMSGDLLAWGNGSGFHDPGEYVLHLGSLRMIKLGESPGGSRVGVAGNQVVWHQPPTNASTILRTQFGILDADFVAGR